MVRSAPKERVSNHRAFIAPSFETPRYARLLRMRSEIVDSIVKQPEPTLRHPYSLSRPRGGLSSFRPPALRGNGAPCGATSGPTPCGVDVPFEARSPHGAPPAAFLSAGTVLPGADTASRRLSPPFIHASSSH